LWFRNALRIREASGKAGRKKRKLGKGQREIAGSPVAVGKFVFL